MAQKRKPQFRKSNIYELRKVVKMVDADAEAFHAFMNSPLMQSKQQTLPEKKNDK